MLLFPLQSVLAEGQEQAAPAPAAAPRDLAAAFPVQYLPFEGSSIITCGPGEGRHIHNPASDTYEAVDFVPLDWSKVRSVAAGKVIYAREGYNFAYGNLVLVRHGEYVTYYGHLASIAVREGQDVAAGETLGIVGATGIATAVHLHFELRVGVDRLPCSGRSISITHWPGLEWFRDSRDSMAQPLPFTGFSGRAVGEAIPVAALATPQPAPAAKMAATPAAPQGLQEITLLDPPAWAKVGAN
jgi:murein DD-endopeptidase MepM/ murein hydrolase activator NlpD